jgi:GT2 family glycosyltransferase
MSKPTPQLDIVVVSYNTREYTLEALRSIYQETTQTSFNLVVVDNNSHDDSANAIEQAFPELTLIRSPRNTGFSGGVNLGVKHCHSDYLLLLNPDTIILDGAIDILYTFAQQKPSNGIWGGITLNDDMSLNTHNAWSRPSTLSLLFNAFGLNETFSTSCFFNKANYGCWQRDTEYEIDMLQGSFFLTQRSLWDQLGGLDETFFMYGEESDYCLKAIQKGYRPIVTPEAKIIHHGGASETNLSDKVVKLLKSKVELINKHSSSWEKPLHRTLLLLYVVNKTMTLRLLSITNSDKSDLSAEWQTVLADRKYWLKGWAP